MIVQNLNLASHLILTVGTITIGAVLGSFATTAAMRGARGERWATGRSHCDTCGVGLSLVGTVPILAFGMQRGRCRSCGSPISWLHLAGEAAGAAILVAALSACDRWTAVGVASLGLLLLYIAVFDALTQRIPDLLSAFVLIVGTAIAFKTGRALEGAAAALGVICALGGLRWAYALVRGREGIGGGDVKLLSALAMGLGMERLALGVFLAAALALGWIALARRAKPAQDGRLAFGPFIALGCWAVACGAPG
jgi:leader peptidase (prepilin peptidase)/N-methyltransferase